MEKCYSRLYVHLVLTVQNRESLILPEWEERLYKFITGMLTAKGNKLLAINGTPDHIHIFFGWNPSLSISEIIRELKKSSNSFIKKKVLHRQISNGRKAMVHFHTAGHLLKML